MGLLRLQPLPLLLIFALLASPALASRDLFENWYPEYGFIFKRIINQNCSSEYDYYRTSHANHTYMREKSYWLGAGPTKTMELIVPLVNCIMNATPEFMKSDMASANVLLGLAPVILAALGSNLDETSVLTVVGNRPFLALALAAGSPSVISMRPFEHRDPLESIKAREDVMRPMFFSFHIEATISIIEHLFVFGAVANVATLGYSLGHDTIMAFAPGYTYLVLIWAFFAPIVHVFAALGLRTRVKHLRDEFEVSCSRLDWFKWLLVGYWDKCPPRKVVLKPENPLFLLMNWVLSIFTAVHVLLGALVFSSMLFISARDAVAVLGRFMASVVVCRLVLSYELAKLRFLYNTDKRSLSGLSETGSYHQLMSWSHLVGK